MQVIDVKIESCSTGKPNSLLRCDDDTRRGQGIQRQMPSQESC